MTDIHIREYASSSHEPTLRVKPAPTQSVIPVPFSYFPSDDGTDENLLILLHGLGKPAIFLNPQPTLIPRFTLQGTRTSLSRIWDVS